MFEDVIKDLSEDQYEIDRTKLSLRIKADLVERGPNGDCIEGKDWAKALQILLS